jgi:hypothetical protein
VNVGSGATFSGHVAGLTAINILGDGNISLLDDVVELDPEGTLLEGRPGFNVYVQAMAEQQAVLKQLQANLPAGAISQGGLPVDHGLEDRRDDSAGLWATLSPAVAESAYQTEQQQLTVPANAGSPDTGRRASKRCPCW